MKAGHESNIYCFVLFAFLVAFPTASKDERKN